MREGGGTVEGFPPRYRLRRAEEFATVLGLRRSVRGDHFQLVYRSTGADTARLGLIVSKKLARHAVSRNRIKRLAREAFRRARATLPEYDLVLRLARAPRSLGRSAVRAEIDKLLEKLPR